MPPHVIARLTVALNDHVNESRLYRDVQHAATAAFREVMRRNPRWRETYRVGRELREMAPLTPGVYGKLNFVSPERCEVELAWDSTAAPDGFGDELLNRLRGKYHIDTFDRHEPAAGEVAEDEPKATVHVSEQRRERPEVARWRQLLSEGYAKMARGEIVHLSVWVDANAERTLGYSPHERTRRRWTNERYTFEDWKRGREQTTTE